MKKVSADKELHPLITAIATGNTTGLVKQLIEKSCQPNMLKHTPKDAAKRFGDKKMFDAWKAGRRIYWLIGKGDDLAGIIWYGKKQFPLGGDVLSETPGETFAIRIYDGYSGHGLAVPAMRQTLKLYARSKKERGEPVTGIWLETDVGNPAALAVYKKFGYREVARDDKRVTMVLDSSDVKGYM